MPSTQVILIRHGETEWNAQGRIMGQLDSSLTPLGLTQAQRLGARLGQGTFSALYSSDLPRAARTAAIIAEPGGHRVILDARLRERNLGIFQGLTVADMEARFPQEHEAYRGEGFDHVVPGGESSRQVLERTLDCLEALASRHDGQTVVVVTHGGVLMSFFEHVIGLPPRSARKFRLPNAGINIFSHDARGWMLETWGDVRHLESLQR